jgi:hypothetical protein
MDQAIFSYLYWLYKFDRIDPNSKSRIHLRVDEDHSGLLVIKPQNHLLNKTALFMLTFTSQQRSGRGTRFFE